MTRKKKTPERRSTEGAFCWQAKEAGRREPERKDRVLQTRVAPSLHAKLLAQARRLRVPVSNLVRNILEDSTRMVENIVDGGLEIAEAIGGGMDEKDLSSVLGWQPMSANRRVVCSRCGRPIPKGGDAWVSVGAPGGRAFVICEGCKCGI
jgi:hypothetical protein